VISEGEAKTMFHFAETKVVLDFERTTVGVPTAAYVPAAGLAVPSIVTEDVSASTRYGLNRAGPLTNSATTEIESTSVVPANLSVAVVAVEVSAVVIVAVAAESVSESAAIAACEGATERTPRPKAATATSATRLIVVDICFLSKVELRTIRISAWAKVPSHK
jgi:hypothetical protein